MLINTSNSYYLFCAVYSVFRTCLLCHFKWMRLQISIYFEDETLHCMHVLSCSLGCFQDFNLFSVLVFILTEKGLHVCTHLKFYFHKDLFTKKTFSTLFMQCCKHILEHYETYENSAYIYILRHTFSVKTLQFSCLNLKIGM